MSAKQHKKLRKHLKETANIDTKLPADYRVQEHDFKEGSMVKVRAYDGKTIIEVPQRVKRQTLYNATKFGIRRVKKALKDNDMEKLTVEVKK
jgi:hypothetical protein